MLSSVGAVLSLILVGYGLDSSAVTLASVAIMTFVTYVPKKHISADLAHEILKGRSPQD